MEIVDLGGRLRHRRLASGRTIASVAQDAGLSVPYIANLENGRGNPTLSAVNRLAEALGVRLALDIADGDKRGREADALPGTLEQFSHTPRFAVETIRLANAAETPEAPTRLRLLHAMAAMGALANKPLSELDWHRILDTAVLITRTAN
jgi:transcriptional regulator with XRE-family HTH domain